MSFVFATRALPAASRLALLFVLAVPTTGVAEEAALSVELNMLEDQPDACRLTFLVENGLGGDLESLVFEAVLFDRSGKVDRLSLFDFEALPQGRPRVRQFDVPGLACASLGRVLINDAESCKGADLDDEACMDGLTLSSRADVEVLG